MTSQPILLSWYTSAIVLCAGVMDIRTRRIPNWFNLSALGGALILQCAVAGPYGLALATLAALLAGGMFFLFFLAGGVGGGDVKLIAAVAAGIGLANTGALLTLTSICGGLLALFMAVRHKQLQASIRNVGSIAMHHYHNGLESHPSLNVRNSRALRMPYAVAIAAGTLLTITLQGAQR